MTRTLPQARATADWIGAFLVALALHGLVFLLFAADLRQLLQRAPPAPVRPELRVTLEELDTGLIRDLTGTPLPETLPETVEETLDGTIEALPAEDDLAPGTGDPPEGGQGLAAETVDPLPVTGDLLSGNPEPVPLARSEAVAPVASQAAPLAVAEPLARTVTGTTGPSEPVEALPAPTAAPVSAAPARLTPDVAAADPAPTEAIASLPAAGAASAGDPALVAPLPADETEIQAGDAAAPATGPVIDDLSALLPAEDALLPVPQASPFAADEDLGGGAVPEDLALPIDALTPTLTPGQTLVPNPVPRPETLALVSPGQDSAPPAVEALAPRAAPSGAPVPDVAVSDGLVPDLPAADVALPQALVPQTPIPEAPVAPPLAALAPPAETPSAETLIPAPVTPQDLAPAASAPAPALSPAQEVEQAALAPLAPRETPPALAPVGPQGPAALPTPPLSEIAPSAPPRAAPSARDLRIARLIERIRAVGPAPCLVSLPRRAGAEGIGLALIGADEAALSGYAGTLIQDAAETDIRQSRVLIDIQQCPVLEFVAQTRDYPATRLGIRLDQAEIPSGHRLSGVVYGAVSGDIGVFLIDNNGVVQDLGRFAERQAGALQFEVPVTRVGPRRDTRHLLLAVASDLPLDPLRSRSGERSAEAFDGLALALTRDAAVGLIAFDLR